MKPFVFKTLNNNSYLYSPVSKRFIPIPKYSYECFKKNAGINNDAFLQNLQHYGYLEEKRFNYDRTISENDIRNALANIPQIVFEVTTHCNFQCKYCCYGNCYETFTNRKDGILNFDSAKILLDYISNCCSSIHNDSYNTPLAISFYGGEPLLNIHLIEQIVEYSKSLNFHNRILKFSLTTNASFLAEHIKFLHDNDFALLVSLDGDSYTSQYRVLKDGTPSFDLVMNNLDLVKTRFPEYFKTIRFNSVFTNLSKTIGLFDFFYSRFGKGTTISPLHVSDGASESDVLKRMRNKELIDPNLIMSTYPDSFLELPIHKKIVQLLMYMTDSFYYNELSFIHSKDDLAIFPTHTCIPFTKRLFLTVDNKIISCEKVNRDNPWGFVTDSSVQLDYAYVANQFNNLISSYKNKCKNCAMEMLCNHCALTSVNSKDCPDFKSAELMEDIFSEIFTYIEDNPDILKMIYSNVILK